MQTNYRFNVNENIKRLITDCLQELAAMDIPVATSIFFREAKGRTYYGTCYQGRQTKRYADYDFVISVNRYLTTEKAFKETIIHELLHTIDFKSGHKGKWKAYADYVNSRTDYNVTRTATHTLAPQPPTRRRRRVRTVRFR
uniref:putative metallopeptidase n=1 Tax=Candidatus Fimenecus sp. TaxID=3022888 RepID=UPI00402A132D